MQKYTYTVTYPMGLCADLAGKLTRAVKEMDSDVTIMNEESGKCVPGTKLMPVMGLSVENGQKVTAIVKGGHEAENIAEIERFFRDNL